MFPVPRYDPNAGDRRRGAGRHHPKERNQKNVASSASRRRSRGSSNHDDQHDASDQRRAGREAGGGRTTQSPPRASEEERKSGSSQHESSRTAKRRRAAADDKDRRRFPAATTRTEEAIDDMDLLLETSSLSGPAKDAIDSIGNQAGGGKAIDNIHDEAMIHRDPVTMEVERDAGQVAEEGDTEVGDGTNEATQQERDVQRAMELSKRSIEDVARQWKLAPFLVQELLKSGYQSFFPIQALVIPFALYQHRVHAFSASGLRCRDVGISAATGSGKTLAYVVPILQALHESTGCLGNVLRALVVLPSRDLARQVHAVFDRFAKGSRLRIGLAVGQSSFEAEQRDLLRRGDDDDDDDDDNNDRRSRDLFVASEGLYAADPRRRKRLELEPGNVRLVLGTFWDGGSWGDDLYLHHNCDADPTGARSRPSLAVDVLVCTPGRLVDHLERGTMTLEHLTYLVVDEADRLLAQRYHNWIDKVLVDATARRTPSSTTSAAGRERHQSLDPFNEFEELDPCRYRIEPITWRHESEALGVPANGEGGDTRSTGADHHEEVRNRAAQPIQLQKFLVSATLTRDPQKLATLRLNHPIHFSLQSRPAEKRYTLPATLQEFTVECTTEQKPLALIAILLDRLERQREELGGASRQQIVIFTSSVDSAHRLTRLLQLLWTAGIAKEGPAAPPSKPASETALLAVAEVSSSASSISAQERAVRLQSRSILVCSDGLSRGMDLPNVSLVVHYDVPVLAKTYVHRCGRTARAGQAGTTVVLLRKGQQTAFAKMRSLIVDAGSSVEAMEIPKPGVLKGAIPLYRKCLAALQSVLRAEGDGDLGLAEEDRLQDFLSDAD